MGLAEKLGLRKAAVDSLNDQIDDVREAWQDAAAAVAAPTMEMADCGWVQEVYADHVIVCVDGAYFSVPYTTDPADEDAITFDMANATEVEQTWTEVAKTVLIEKVDEDRHVAFGWAYVSERDGKQVVDHSDEFIAKADLEDAAYLFNMEFRAADEVHTDPVVGQLVESFVSTPEKLQKMGLAPDALPTGWWTGWYVPDDAIFAKIKDGTYSMLSIGGAARKERVDA